MDPNVWLHCGCGLEFQRGALRLECGCSARRARLRQLGCEIGEKRASGGCSAAALCWEDSRPWTDSNNDAAWRDTLWTRTGWLEAHDDCHVAFRAMPQAGIDLFYPDWMHCKHLGTDQYLTGSVFAYLAHEAMPGQVQDNIEEVMQEIQAWYKEL